MASAGGKNNNIKQMLVHTRRNNTNKKRSIYKQRGNLERRQKDCY
jgi:hypothetical protein